MLKVISKLISADFSNPGSPMNETYFDQWLDQMGWTNRSKQKKNVISVPGMGSNDRGHNPGAGMGLGRDENESKDKTLSSGYNNGDSAQQSDNNEAGPGFSPSGTNPYFNQNVDNQLFSDLTNMKGATDRDKARQNVSQLYNSRGVEPAKRYRVDARR